MHIPADAQKFSSRYAPLNRPVRVEPEWSFDDGYSPRGPRFSGGDERYTLALAQRLQAEVATREEAVRALDNTAQDSNPKAGEVKTATGQLDGQGFSCQEGDFAWSRQGEKYTGVTPRQAAVAEFSAEGVALSQYRW